MKHDMLAVLGAVVGGFVGFFAVGWIASQGFYAMIVPGGLIGLGAGLARSQSTLIAVACGAAGLAVGLLAEWHNFPFLDDDSLGFFMENLKQLRPITWIMILIGAFLAFWIPFRSIDPGRLSSQH